MNFISPAAIVGIVCLATCGSAAAQVYDNPQNLKVLPADISATDLRETMKGFSLGTGFRCSDCHMGEESQPLTEYDFASDGKALKQRARKMLKMVNALNDEYLVSFGPDRARVGCVTCHRGLHSPRTTAEVLTRAADEGGVEKLLATYSELKEKYYGTHSYDFSEFLLGEFVRSRSAAGKPEEALAMLDILSEEHPDSYWISYLYGETLERQGKVEEALGHYRKAIALDPESTAWIAGHIAKLEASPQESDE